MSAGGALSNLAPAPAIPAISGVSTPPRGFNANRTRLDDGPKATPEAAIQEQSALCTSIISLRVLTQYIIYCDYMFPFMSFSQLTHCLL